jgi:aspartyl-tRNA(Asn)/glutamyl-tRNA(Gln) amidotransferase subunit B
MSWEIVIGLETHVQLATQSKIFSGASTAFGAAPNSQACAVDLGLPGVLPVLNREAVRMAVRFGLAIGAEIHPRSVFDRKNYFYPDLPKGYQISQFESPIVGRGKITVDLKNDETVDVTILRAHLEEDAGKSIHDAFAGQTGVDLNRTGTPLLEIVTEPDMRSAEQAAAYFRQLHNLVRYLKICDGNLAEGSMRCDVNVSVRRHGETEFGERAEIKNINSFRFVERAVRVEAERQIDILEAGGRVERDTRLYDEVRDETRSMRSKELSDDYRYFPDPDLLPVEISEEFIEEVRAGMPELPGARQTRFINDLGLSEYDAFRLTDDPDTADYFETLASEAGDVKLAANWVLGELSASLNRDSIAITSSPIGPVLLGQLLSRINEAVISGNAAKTVFEALWQGESDVDAVIRDRGLEQMSDSGALEAIVTGIVEANPSQAADYRAGKDKLLGFFVGQVMKATQGKANPKEVNELVRKALSS